MASPAAVLSILVEANTSAANANLAKTNAELDAAKVAGAGATSATSKTSSAMRKLGTAAKWGGAALAVGFVAAVKSSVDTTNELTKSTLLLTKNFGLSGKAASEWAGVARARGADATKLGMAFKTLASQISSAADGSDTSVKMFKALGFTQKDIQKSMEDSQFAIGKVAAGFEDLPPGMQKANLAGKLFGRGWQTIFPILRDGRAAMQDQLDAVEKYGGVLAGKTLKQQEDFLAAQRESKIAWQGMQVTLGTALTPALTQVNEQFQKIAAIMASDKLTDDQKFSQIADIIETDMSKALDVIVQMIPTIASRVGEQAPKIAQGLITGFLDSNVWGKLLLGTWFITKLGGWAAVGKVGESIGARMGLGMSTGLAATPILGGLVAAFVGLKVLHDKIADSSSEAIKQGFKLPGNIPLAFKKEQEAIKNLQGSVGDLRGARQREKNTADAESKAEHRLLEIRKRYGPDSQEAIKAERDARDATAAHRRAVINLKNAEILHGVQKVVAIKLMRDAAEGEKQEIANLRQQRIRILDNVKATGVKNMSDKQLQMTGGRLDQITQQLTTHQDHLNKIQQNAAQQVGPKFAKALLDDTQKTEKFKDSLSALTQQNKRVNKSSDETAKHLKGVGKQADNVGESFRNMSNTAKAGIDTLRDNTNAALKALGLDKAVQFRTNEAPLGKGGVGHRAGAQRGAVIPGTGDGDKVHVMAEPGEGFINKTAVKALGGPKAINAINAAIPRFARGGSVGGDTAGLVAPFLGALHSMSGATHTPINVISGFRSRAEQERLYQLYLSGQGNLAAVPGTSHHELGIAADISPGRETFGGVAGKFGMGFTVPSESWHIELLNAAAGKFGAGPQKIARIILQGPAGAVRNMGQGSLDKTRNAANAFIRKQWQQMGQLNFTGGKFDLNQLAQLWIGARGSRGIAPLMAHVAMAESGGDPNARNPSGASGLWQILGQLVPGNIFDPHVNALNAVAKYKTQGLGAWAASQSAWGQYAQKGGMVMPPFGGSFGQGGVVPGPIGSPRTIVAHGGESVGAQPVIHIHIDPSSGAGMLEDRVQAVIDDDRAYSKQLSRMG